MEFSAKLSGMELVRARIAKLPEAVGYRAMRRALRRGANVVRDTARENARAIDDPVTGENIAKNIVSQGVSRRTENANGGPMMRVGVLGGARNYANTKENRRGRRVGESYKTGGSKGNPGGDTWHWRLVEFGFTPKGGAPVAARPILRTAGNDVAKIAQVTADAMVVEMDKELDKLGIK